MLVLVLAAGVWWGSSRPPMRMQPATSLGVNGRVRRRTSVAQLVGPLLAAPVDDDDTNFVMDTLRVLGIVRRRVDRPVVGRKAYVRWWERLRAISVLAAIVIALGLALAAVVGITVLGLGFLLERAIS